MRHRVAHRKLGRVTEHRIAMLRSQASNLIDKGHIETTVARAKELRPFVERIISVAKRSLKAGDAVTNVTARRTVSVDIANREVVSKLFAEIAPRYADRSGGYTRMLRLGRRRGDDAEIAQVELIGSEFDPAAEAKKKEAAGGDDEPSTRKRSIGERVRALGGGKKAEKTKAPKAKTSKGAGRKITAPRKAGGA
jgi:large subunit ribosomal protein L17